jgi:hypothetical protein
MRGPRIVSQRLRQTLCRCTQKPLEQLARIRGHRFELRGRRHRDEIALVLRHTLNLRHVIIQNLLLAATIPFDGCARPILFSDGALIGFIVDLRLAP